VSLHASETVYQLSVSISERGSRIHSTAVD
jgi:hypothetical protein